jgi:hypothetical protein
MHTLTVLAVLLGSGVFGAVAVYALVTGRVPIRNTAGIRRGEHPFWYWVFVAFYGGAFLVVCWGVWRELAR